MKKHLRLTVALLACAPVPLAAQPDLQQSHIEANVPPLESFEGFLDRDLLAYFKASGIQTATAVVYKPLRNGPTQSGLSYPKYYLWVKVLLGSKVVQEGAVRVAAVEYTHFEVTNFMSKTQIQEAPSSVGSVFPVALVQSVRSLAGAK
ncbi:MAG: hypothetical protein ABL970_04260 [Nitrospira sp.]